MLVMFMCEGKMESDEGDEVGWTKSKEQGCGDKAELGFSLVQAQPCLRGATTLHFMEADKNFDTPRQSP